MLKKALSVVIAGQLIAAAVGVQSATAADSLWDQLTMAAVKALVAHNFGEAEKSYTQALAVAQKPPVDQARLSKSRLQLAWVYFRQGKYAQAEPYLRQVLSQAEKSNNSEVVQNGIQAVDAIAFLDTQRGKYREAESLYARLSGASVSVPGFKPVINAEGVIGRVNILAAEGRYNEARTLLAQADSLIKQIQPPVPNQAAAMQNSQTFAKYIVDMFMAAFITAFKKRADFDRSVAQGNVFYAEGNLDQAESTLRKAAQNFQSKSGGDAPVHVLAFIPLGKICLVRGKISDADEYFRRSKAVLDKEAVAERPFIETCQINLAKVAIVRGKYAEAEELLKQAQTSLEKSLGAESLPLGDCWVVKGDLNKAQSKLTEGETCYRTALAMKEKLLGKGAPGTGAAMNGLASILKTEGKVDEAAQLYNDCVANHEKQALGGSVQASIAVAGQADVARQQGDLPKAETLYLSALGNMERYLMSSDATLISLYGNLGDIYLAQSKYPQAESLLRKKVTGLERAGKTSDDQYLLALNNLAEADIGQQKWQNADEVLSRLLSLQEKGSKVPTGTLTALAKYSEVATKLGNQPRAEQVSSRLKALGPADSTAAAATSAPAENSAAAPSAK